MNPRFRTALHRLIFAAISGPAGGCYYQGPAHDISVGWTITDELLMSDHWTSSASGAVQQDGVDAYRAGLQPELHTVRLCHAYGSTFEGLIEIYNVIGDRVAWIPALSPTDGQVIGTFTPLAQGDFTIVVSQAGGLSTSNPSESKWYVFRIETGDHTGEPCHGP